MIMARMRALAGMTVVLLLSLSWLAWAADSETALRSRALALNEITGERSIEGEIKALSDDPESAKKLVALAARMAKEKDQPFHYNAAYVLASTALELDDLETGRVFYHLCANTATKLQSVAKLAQVYDGLSLLFFQNEKYEDCAKICKQCLELPLDSSLRAYQSLMIRRYIIALANQPSKVDEALKMVNKLQEGQADNLSVLELKGQVLRLAGRNDEALKTFEDVLDRVSKDKSLPQEERDKRTDLLRYYLSGLYVDANHLDKATEMLKGLLDKKPNDPTYNNDLGYIWADHDKNLDEAEKLIRKALEEDRKKRKAESKKLRPGEDKDNAAFLDSLGWVLFKKKQYREAKIYLLQATQDKKGQHIEILDHLGDVHMALGEKAEAVAVWKKAIETKVSSKRDQERKTQVEKKIKANQSAAEKGTKDD